MKAQPEVLTVKLTNITKMLQYFLLNFSGGSAASIAVLIKYLFLED